MPSSETLYHPTRRSSWFRSPLDGLWTTAKREDEVLHYTFDLADQLDSGETVSAVSWDEDGVTLTNEATSGTTYSVDVEGTGTAEATITTSSSRTIIKKYRWRGIDTDADDYS